MLGSRCGLEVRLGGDDHAHHARQTGEKCAERKMPKQVGKEYGNQPYYANVTFRCVVVISSNYCNNAFMKILELMNEGKRTEKMVEDVDTNTELRSADALFYHNMLHTAGRVNDEILASTPPGTVIVDCAGGFYSRWEPSQLSERGNSLVVIDQDWAALGRRTDAGLGVQIDLNAVPAAVSRLTLPGVFKRLMEYPELSRQQAELRTLLEACSKGPAGAWIFSSCLPGFSKNAMERLIHMACLNLHLDGRIHLFESTRQDERIAQAESAAANALLPAQKIRDDLLFPLITREQHDLILTRAAIAQQTHYIDSDQFCGDELFELMKTGECHVGSIPYGKYEKGKDFVKMSDSEHSIGAVKWSQRWIELARSRQEGRV